MARGSQAKRPAGRSPQLTHFLCIPLTQEASRQQLDSSIDVFRKEVATELPRQAIRPVGTLHLTLGVMALSSQQLSAAKALLEGLDVAGLLTSPITDGVAVTPLRIQLKGLESMHETDSTSVLYVEPKDDTGRLRDFCLALRAVFEAQQLLIADDRPLRLHATVVNTIYAKGLMPRPPPQAETSAAPARTKGSLKFDARHMLERYKTYTWAENVRLDRLAICEMGAKKEHDNEGRLIDEHYKEVAHIALPI